MKESIKNLLFASAYITLIIMVICVFVLALLLIWGEDKILFLKLMGTDIMAIVILVISLNIFSDFQ